MATDESQRGATSESSPDAPDVAHENLRRNIAARLTRLITSEEGLRSVVNAVIPKELIASTLDQMDATKSEAMAMVGRELRTFLAHLDVGDELAKILTAVSFEIKLEVRFVPNEDGTLRAKVRGGAKPKVRVESRRKAWQRRAAEDAAENPADADDTAATVGTDPGARRSQAGGATSNDAQTGAAPPEAEAPIEAAAARAHTSPDGARKVRGAAAEPVADETEHRLRDLLGRRSFTSMVERVADVAATTARVAAEVAADAAAEVVNEARRSRSNDDSFDDY